MLRGNDAIKLLKFYKERETALASLNKDKLIKYCHKYDIPIPRNEEVFWAGVHKARIKLFNENKLDVNDYLISRDWLVQHGYKLDIN